MDDFRCLLCRIGVILGNIFVLDRLVSSSFSSNRTNLVCYCIYVIIFFCKRKTNVFFHYILTYFSIGLYVRRVIFYSMNIYISILEDNNNQNSCPLKVLSNTILRGK